MLNDFRHYSPTCFIFGRDAELKIGQTLAGDGVKTVLLCRSSDEFLVKTGLLGRVTGELTSHGIRVVELDGIVPNPRLKRVYDGIEIARREKVDAVVAVGGGSVIDTAKSVAAGVKYDGDVWDFYNGKAGKPKEALPVSVVLTLPATGSESGGVSVINNEDIHVKALTSADCLRPRFAFMDPQLCCTLPPFMTACGIADMLSHAMERYFSDDDELNSIDYMCEGVMKAIVTFGRKVMADPQNYQYRAEIMWLGTVAHNDTVGVGRNQDWSSHNIANELSALYDTPHGASLSIITPAWMEYVYEEHLWRFARFARTVFDVTEPDDLAAAREGIRRTTEFFKELKLPTSFEEFNIPTDRIEEMAETASHAFGTNEIGAFKVLNKADIITIFKNSIGKR